MKIDLKLWNNLHGPMHCKIGDICVFIRTRILYSVVITWQSNPPISHFNSLCYEVSGQCSYTIYITKWDLGSNLQHVWYLRVFASTRLCDYASN